MACRIYSASLPNTDYCGENVELFGKMWSFWSKLANLPEVVESLESFRRLYPLDKKPRLVITSPRFG
jgi:hypothetical protein